MQRQTTGSARCHVEIKSPNSGIIPVQGIHISTSEANKGNGDEARLSNVGKTGDRKYPTEITKEGVERLGASGATAEAVH